MVVVVLAVQQVGHDRRDGRAEPRGHRAQRLLEGQQPQVPPGVQVGELVERGEREEQQEQPRVRPDLGPRRRGHGLGHPVRLGGRQVGGEDAAHVVVAALGQGGERGPVVRLGGERQQGPRPAQDVLAEPGAEQLVGVGVGVGRGDPVRDGRASTVGGVLDEDAAQFHGGRGRERQAVLGGPQVGEGGRGVHVVAVVGQLLVDRGDHGRAHRVGRAGQVGGCRVDPAGVAGGVRQRGPDLGQPGPDAGEGRVLGRDRARRHVAAPPHVDLVAPLVGEDEGVLVRLPHAASSLGCAAHPTQPVRQFPTDRGAPLSRPPAQHQVSSVHSGHLGRVRRCR